MVLCGQKFGKLLVIDIAEDYIDPKSKKHIKQYLCQCDCGNIIVTSGKLLRSNHKLSCGCNSRSRGEQYVEAFLSSKEIIFKSEYSFTDLVDKKPLRFDFVLFKNN